MIEYRVTGAAKLLGVSADTLRGWDRRGILVPARRRNQQRYYQSDELSEACERLATDERIDKKPVLHHLEHFCNRCRIEYNHDQLVYFEAPDGEMKACCPTCGEKGTIINVLANA